MEKISGRFVLVRRLGDGDASAVYLARDEALDRPVAVRVLDPDLAGPEAGSRFRREGRAAARLSHPNVVRVYDVEEVPVDGRKTFCIVMEYVPGGDLEGLLDRNGPLPLAMLSRIGADVAAGLAHAHERGVVHGDVKPRNVLIDEYGSPKLTDFGIARALDTDRRAGSDLGTALYSSPERLRGEKVTPKSDVYSLGATLYHAATGQPPFVGSPIEVASQQIERSPVPPRERGAAIGRRFEALILGCLSRDPAARPDASHLHERLLQTGTVAAGANTAPRASNGSVGAGAAGAALRNIGGNAGGGVRAAGAAGLSRAAASARAAGLRGLAGARAVGQRLDRRGGGEEEPGGPPGMTVTVPTRTFQSGAHRRNLLAVLAAALVSLLLLVGGAWALLGPGEEEAANPPGDSPADGGRRDDGANQQAQAPARQESGGEANGEPPGGGAGPSGASNGASGGTREAAPVRVPPPAQAEKAVYDMYVDQSYRRVDATWNALSERLQGDIGSPERWAEQEDHYTFAYMEYVSLPTATVSGDTARVAFQARLDHTWGSELLSGTWVCVVEDGEWKLDRLENETVQAV